ncbi:MAG TPA: protein-methionine-sulfoxide reductase heme-binding subunit MsrQ, partial [Longimicrobiales bacterium]|nr:protein-methionine-sulfoxide reductase heme-binding subunit MsrQ [Longimicrobiales bacterium]
QRVRRPGGPPLRGDGPPGPLLSVSTRGRIGILKAAVWVGALAPAANLARGAWSGGLGADPVESLLQGTGTWALVLLLVTLAVTPIRRVTGWNAVIRVRRLLGLFSYFYAVLHVGVYVVLDQGLAPAFILEDVAERPWITAGAGAFLILTLLAGTSTRGWIRRLGRAWRRLHRAVYAAGGLVVLHALLQVKADAREPLVFGAVFSALMLFRLPWRRVGRALDRLRDRAGPGKASTSTASAG